VSKTKQPDKEKLDGLIDELYDLGERIKAVDKLLGQVKDNKLRDTYHDSLTDMIQGYKKLCMKVKSELRMIIAYEKKNNLPITLLYRRLYNKLK
jgi:hypothetical protein